MRALWDAFPVSPGHVLVVPRGNSHRHPTRGSRFHTRRDRLTDVRDGLVLGPHLTFGCTATRAANESPRFLFVRHWAGVITVGFTALPITAPAA